MQVMLKAKDAHVPAGQNHFALHMSYSSFQNKTSYRSERAQNNSNDFV